MVSRRLSVSSPAPGLMGLQQLDTPPVAGSPSMWAPPQLAPPTPAGYLRRSGSRALAGAQEAVHRAAAGGGRQVGGQPRWGNMRGGGAAGRSEQLLQASSQPSSGGAGLILTPTGLGRQPTWPFQGFSGLGTQG